MACEPQMFGLESKSFTANLLMRWNGWKKRFCWDTLELLWGDMFKLWFTWLLSVSRLSYWSSLWDWGSMLSSKMSSFRETVFGRLSFSFEMDIFRVFN